MDNSEITHWVKDHTHKLYTRALQKTGNSNVAMDLVQDTFVAAVEGFHKFRRESSPLTWLFAILNRKITDYYRHRFQQPVNVDPDYFLLFFSDDGEWIKKGKPSSWTDDDEHLLDNEAFLAVLEECLSLLPDKWGVCVKLKYYMNKKGSEICQELEISPSNLWQIMHRAKLRLRDCVETNWTQK